MVVVNIVDTIEEAVELANNTDYSLAAGVWTRDVYKAFDISSRIRACESLLRAVRYISDSDRYGKHQRTHHTRGVDKGRRWPGVRSHCLRRVSSVLGLIYFVGPY